MDKSHGLAKETRDRSRLMEEMTGFVKDAETSVIWPSAFGTGRGAHDTNTLSQNAFLTY